MKRNFIWKHCTWVAIIIILLSGCGTNDVSAESPSASSKYTPTGAETEFENPNVENEDEPMKEEEELLPPSIEDKAKAAMEQLEVWDGSVAESFDGGDGSAENPYQIANGAQLAKLASDTNSGVDFSTAYFVLTSDILLNDVSKWDFEQNIENYVTGIFREGNQWTPIGLNYSFGGNFDGCGHVIFGIYNVHSYYSTFYADKISRVFVGLFGAADHMTISNVSVACGILSPSAQSVGAIVGELYDGTIYNCHVEQMLIENNASTSSPTVLSIGGLCGISRSGAIVDSSVETVEIYYNQTYSGNRNFSVGGIVGVASGEISSCYSNCNIQTNMSFVSNYSSKSDVPSIYAGGICGTGEAVTNCYSLSNIAIQAYNKLDDDSEDSPYIRAGGIAGQCGNDISNCGSYGTINYQGDIEETYLGGIVGLLGSSLVNTEAQAIFCYSNEEMLGEVDSENIGGIVSRAGGDITVKNCYYNEKYSSKAVAATLDLQKESVFGGSNYYWIYSTLFTDQLKALSDDELCDSSNYYNWDFDTTWTTDAKINDGLPILTSFLDYFKK